MLSENGSAIARSLARSVFQRVAGPYSRWKSRTPVRWARFGRLSLLAAKVVKPLAPPVLIISLPRSGSSWVGEILGSAANALYLREPINQSVIAAEGEAPLIPIDPERVGSVYALAADYAFSGLPLFPEDILWNPYQWPFIERRNRRLVIKEVNPLACRWLLQFKPRVVFLVRHPAAVALSHRKMGWWHSVNGGWSEKDCWRIHGEYQATILHGSNDSLLEYPDLLVVQYEQLCERPLAVFAEMFDFAGLHWDATIKQLIAKRSLNYKSPDSSDDLDPYSTTRNSLAMIDAWRTKMTGADLDELQKGYETFNLPWYRSEKDWQPETTSQDIA